jgi:hypothetical protein
VGIDLGYSEVLADYCRSREGATLIQANSQTEEFSEFVSQHGPFDLVLIDGSHDEAPCRRDFETVRGHARTLVFHDIVSHPVPGVGKVWREVKERYPERFEFLEFTDQYADFSRETGATWFGIGMAVDREMLAARR